MTLLKLCLCNFVHNHIYYFCNIVNAYHTKYSMPIFCMCKIPSFPIADVQYTAECTLWGTDDA